LAAASANEFVRRQKQNSWMARLRGPKRLLSNWIIAAALVFGVALPAFAALQFPPLTGRIVDEANLLSPGARQRIDGWLTQFEAATGRQVVVATVKSLQGVAIEDYGYQLGRFWGIGQKDKNTGAILLVAPTEHKVRIEVGYGLEGELTDAASSTIINQIILPQFRAGKYEAGIVGGTAAILNALGWSGASAAIPKRPAPQKAGALAFVPFLLVFVMFWFFAWRLSRHGPHGIAGAMIGYGIGSAMGGGFRAGGGGFSGGGFSGGGGSFGGGGASGSW
jgi:uncharacterized protein